jgi:hypothetical protein
MELIGSKRNVRFYNCYLNEYNFPIVLSGLNNIINCRITSDYYVYDSFSDEESLRKERIEKLKEIFDGEL